MKFILLLLAGLSIELTFSSCEYHDAETLYPTICDTTQVTYSLVIAPLIDVKCSECHAGEISSGISLEDYDNLKVQIDGERLIGSIRHLDNFSAMPKERLPLTECEIQTIERWVQNGALNN